MARNTKRIFSIGSASGTDGDRRAGPDRSAAPSAELEDDPAARIDAAEGSAEVHRVVEVGVEPAAEGDTTEELPTRRFELPRKEKPLPLTRAQSSTDEQSAHTGPAGTIRVSPERMAELAAEGVDHEADDGVAPSSDGVPPAWGARRCPRCETPFTSPEVQFCPFDGERVVAVVGWDPGTDPLVGRTVSDRYEVQAVLAEGSMGTVYRVMHRRLGARFAMKVLRRDLAREPEVAERLIDEAKTTAAIGHPNIVGVSDFGEIGTDLLPDLDGLRLPYFVMELLDGPSLADEVRRRGALDPTRTARIAAQCANALAAAHQQGVIHRDLKPANIRLCSSRVGTELVKLVDFGVAKIMTSSRKTQPGIVYGTPHYMSPEQGKGLGIDERTDIYALGVIMYECLTGKVPFEADTYMGVVTKHLFTRPEPLKLADGDLSGAELEPVVMRCLAKAPEDRYRSMSDLAADLDRVARGDEPRHGGPVPSRRPMRLRDPVPSDEAERTSTAAPAGAPQRRMGWLPWVGAGLVLLGALLLALRWLRPDALLGGDGDRPSPTGAARTAVLATAGATAPVASAGGRTTTTSTPSASGTTTASGVAPAASTAVGEGETSPRPASPPAPVATATVEVPVEAPTTGVSPTPPAPSTAPSAPPSASKPPRPSGEVVDPWAR